MRWQQFPFVRLLLPFMAGIMAYRFAGIQFSFAAITVVVFVAGSAIWFIPEKTHAHFRRRNIFGFFVNACLLLLGPLILQLRHDGKDIPDLPDADYVLATVTEEPVMKTRSCKTGFRIDEVVCGTEHIPVNKGAIVYSPLDFGHTKLLYGDRVVLKASWERIRKPANPYQFNYRDYLAANGIYYQAYVDNAHIAVLDTQSVFSSGRCIHSLRRAMISQFRKLSLHDQELAVASALLIGYREELDGDTKAAYSHVGAMHILSVSGLHVGVVFILVGKLLFFLRKGWQLWARFLVILWVLWFYALLSGASPSVLRAAVMFSFLLPGTIWKVPSNTYNTIALSAFFLMLFNPLLLFDIGFQLSYIAVAGIVFLYPRMRFWWVPRHRSLRWLWSSIAVSLAAQLFTTPLTLYYFGQFPNYFLVSNLIIVPLSSGVIYTGIAALALAYVPYASAFVGWLLSWSIRIMNGIIYLIEKLPYSYADNLPLSLSQTIVFYLLIAAGILFFESRKLVYLKASLLFLIVFIGMLGYRQIRLRQQRYFIVYNLNKSSHMEIIDGKTAYVCTGAELSETNYGLFVRPFHQVHGILRTQPMEGKNVHVSGPVILFGNRSVFIYDSLAAQVNYSSQIEVDYLWMRYWKKKKPSELLEHIHCQTVILDNRLSKRKEKNWKETCDSLGVSCYSLRDEGAFVQKW